MLYNVEELIDQDGLLVIVEVGGSQAATKEGANLFPVDDECRLDCFLHLTSQCNRALGRIPRRPRYHCVLVTAQQFFLL